MTAAWYYRSGQETVGPLAPRDLRAKAQAGEVLPDTLVSKGADGPWVPARNVKGLFTQADGTGAAAASSSGAVEPPVPPPLARAAPPSIQVAPEPTGRRRRSRAPLIGMAVAVGLAGVLIGVWAVTRSASDPVPKGSTAASGTAESPGERPSPEPEAPGGGPTSEEPADSPTAPSSVEPSPSLPSGVPEAAPDDREPAEAPQDPPAPPGATTQPPGALSDSEPPLEPVEGEPEEEPASAAAPAPVTSGDGFAPNLGPDPFAADAEPAEPMGPEEPPADGQDIPAAATEDLGGGVAPVEADPRLEGLESVFKEQVGLFREWKPASEELKGLEEELAVKTVELNQNQQRQRNNLFLAQNIEAELAALKEEFGPNAQSPRLVDGMLTCQRNARTLAQREQEIMSETAKLAPKIKQLQPTVRRLAKQLDELSQRGLALSDPFGTSPGPVQHRAIEVCAEWMRSEPGLVLPHLAGAFAYAHTDQTDFAREELAIARELDDRLTALCTAADGYVYAVEGEFQKSRARFAEAVRADPKLGITYGLWGLACIEEEKASQAETHLRKALALTKDSPEFQEQLTGVLESIQRPRAGSRSMGGHAQGRDASVPK